MRRLQDEGFALRGQLTPFPVALGKTQRRHEQAVIDFVVRMLAQVRLHDIDAPARLGLSHIGRQRGRMSLVIAIRQNGLIAERQHSHGCFLYSVQCHAHRAML